jgi:hypothetical protein
LRERFGAFGGVGFLLVLPIEPAADRGEQQHDRGDDLRRVLAGRIAQLVAAKILIHLAKECFAAVRWNRQDVPQPIESGNFAAGGFLPHRR